MQYMVKYAWLTKIREQWKRRKTRHCSKMLPVPGEEEEDCRCGAERLGSFTGAAQRSGWHRRLVTRPGADRRGRRRSVELLEVEQTIGATSEETEGTVALQEVVRTSDDRRGGVLLTRAARRSLSSPEKKERQWH